MLLGFIKCFYERGLVMKNKALSFLLIFVLIAGCMSVSVFAAGMSIYPAQGYYEFEEDEIGEKFVVDFMLDGNEGYNNSTFRIKYDPNVIRAIPNETSDKEGFISYAYSRFNSLILFPNSSIESQLNVVPSRGQKDFEGQADGKKTSAEIGIIKLGQLVRSNVEVFEITDNGIFLRMTFKVVGPGETDIEMLKAVGSKVLVYGIDSVARDVSVEPAHVKVKGEVVESTETTTLEEKKDNSSDDKNSTETTTSANKSDSNSNSTESTTSSSSDKSSGNDSSKSDSSGSNSSGSGSSGSGKTGNRDSESDDNNDEDKDKDEKETVDDRKTKNDDNTTVMTAAFSDISNYPWAKDAINYLYKNKIINGIGNGLYAPAANVKRADFLIMLMNAFGIDSDKSESGFADVPASKYYAKAVGAAKAIGIAAGDNNGNFRPEEFISRQDMMVLAYRTLVTQNYEIVEDSSGLDKFADKESVSEYARESLNSMVKAKIVNGTGSNIEPKNNTTRAQSAVIIYNICQYINK